MNELVYITKGIYSTNEKPRRGFDKNRVIVAVHPLYLRKNSPPSDAKEYEKKLKTSLAKINASLVIFEEEDEIIKTLNILSPIPEKTIFIPTINFLGFN